MRWKTNRDWFYGPQAEKKIKQLGQKARMLIYMITTGNCRLRHRGTPFISPPFFPWVARTSWIYNIKRKSTSSSSIFGFVLFSCRPALLSFLVPKLRDSMQSIMGCGVSNGWGKSSLGYLFGSDAPTTTNPVEKPPPVAAVAQPKG